MKELKSNYDLRNFILVLNELSKISKSLHRHFEIYCMRDLTPREEKAVKRLKARVDEICSEQGLFFFIQQDPRGGTLYISMDPIDDRDYSKGVCIF